MNVQSNGYITWSQIEIGQDFPVQLVLVLETKEVVFVVVNPFTAIYDMSTEGVDAYFDSHGFGIEENTYSYNTPYKYAELPDMLGWLQEQKLQLN